MADADQDHTLIYTLGYHAGFKGLANDPSLNSKLLGRLLGSQESSIWLAGWKAGVDDLNRMEEAAGIDVLGGLFAER